MVVRTKRKCLSADKDVKTGKGRSIMTNTIINTIVTNNNGAINDHTGKVQELAGICQLQNGNIGALLDTDKAYSINELYVDKDGVPHISTKSITGVVTVYNDVTTKEGIAIFNNGITLDSHKIAKVVLIKVINA